MTYQFDFDFLATGWPALLAGAWVTVKLTLFAVLFGGALGTACAIARVFGGRIPARLVAIYVELIRNTPLLVQIFIVYFGLAGAGLALPAVWAAAIALAVNMGAYASEIMRAGIESIKRTQIEAGRTLGLSQWQRIAYIVLPPATERVYPALVSQIVLIMLSTSITSQISVEELSAAGNALQSETFRSFETYVVVAVIYLVLASASRLVLHAIGVLGFPQRRHRPSPR